MQSEFYTLSQETAYKWVPKQLAVVDKEKDYAFCPTEWPKNVQISPNEWLFFGGGDQNQSMSYGQTGTTLVTRLNTKTQRLTKLTDIPKPSCAHQVIYLPSKDKNQTDDGKSGFVYVFGGLADMSTFQPHNYKYDIEKDEWKEICRWIPGNYRLSFNLLPLIENRFIMVISQEKPYLLDTKTDKWVRLHQKGHLDLEGVQIGAFTLPIIEHVVEVPKEQKTAFDDDHNDKDTKGFESDKVASQDIFYSEGEDLNADEYGYDKFLYRVKPKVLIEKEDALQTASEIMMDKVENRRIEMIWFGGVSEELSDHVFHVTLKLDLLDNDGKSADKIEV